MGARIWKNGSAISPRRLESLERENKRLKKIAREFYLDKDIVTKVHEVNSRSEIATCDVPAHPRSPRAERLGVSERRNWQAVRHPRSTWRYESKPPTRDYVLTQRIERLALQHPG